LKTVTDQDTAMEVYLGQRRVAFVLRQLTAPTYCSKEKSVTYQAREGFVTRDKGKSLHFQPLAIVSIADTMTHRVKHSPVAVQVVLTPANR